MLTTQIIATADADDLRATIATLPADTGVVVLAERPDEVRAAVADRGAVIGIPPDAPRDQVRNRHLGDGWTLTLEPGERLLAGTDLLESVCDGPPAVHRLMIVRPDLVTKEPRLLHRRAATFAGAVFETPHPDRDATTLGVLVAGTSGPDRSGRVRAWRQAAPLAAEPLYYEAGLLLAAGDHDGFLRVADKYLFRCEAMSLPVAMTRYYMSLVYCHVKRDARRAIDSLMPPLIYRPVMAEFWCLMGDIHLHLLGAPEKAEQFYRNATVFGRHRRPDDPWPVQPSRYRDHPARMIEMCQRARDDYRVLTLAG
jgi:hypothetical protein